MILNPSTVTISELMKLMASNHMRVNFSQFGEDAVMWTFLQNKKDGFYVDVGAHHPFRYSNTALLHFFRGWTGLNIDVDQRCIDQFVVHRPRDINICAGVAAIAGDLEVTLFADAAINTFDPKMANDPRWAAMDRRKVMVTVHPLRDLLTKHLPAGRKIDFMSIDVEGLDLDALKSNDWDMFRPRFVAIEVHGFNLNHPSENPIFSYLREQGYALRSHAFATSIYIDGRNHTPFV